jgi:hypothetical protein
VCPGPDKARDIALKPGSARCIDFAAGKVPKQGFPKADAGFGIKTPLKQRDLSSHSLAKPGLSAYGRASPSRSFMPRV